MEMTPDKWNRVKALFDAALQPEAAHSSRRRPGAWTRLRVSNGALEGMNNKIKVSGP